MDSFSTSGYLIPADSKLKILRGWHYLGTQASGFWRNIPYGFTHYLAVQNWCSIDTSDTTFSSSVRFLVFPCVFSFVSSIIILIIVFRQWAYMDKYHIYITVNYEQNLYVCDVTCVYLKMIVNFGNTDFGAYHISTSYDLSTIHLAYVQCIAQHIEKRMIVVMSCLLSIQNAAYCSEYEHVLVAWINPDSSDTLIGYTSIVRVAFIGTHNILMRVWVQLGWYKIRRRTLGSTRRKHIVFEYYITEILNQCLLFYTLSLHKILRVIHFLSPWIHSNKACSTILFDIC